ncbi:sugar transferase [Chloroherpeton thalassium ATCC 35110]|uniref:Sugar transferase n=1 Tax=Chloroherpeton thalassium (strain ATCC 35110 / GB-78) TaxID=517418 RepID=B3QVK1_CHLT3|nr:sugar transferase [Chloroherpeton thalassium]ACF14601.1 sugar transferase [Chloroherpeton thalassium ATCC 35110]
MLYKIFIKRLFDLMVSFLFLSVFGVFFILIALAIKLESKGPVFFNQIRLGREGKTFNLYKFRTMTDNPARVHGSTEVFENNPEVTKVGNILRRYKIDELPQLINVFKGDMSIVGPRPMLPQQEEVFDQNGKKRLDVLPGCTGLAQVNGNIYLPWNERWKYDAYYVDNLSLFLDIKYY